MKKAKNSVGKIGLSLEKESSGLSNSRLLASISPRLDPRFMSPPIYSPVSTIQSNLSCQSVSPLYNDIYSFLLSRLNLDEFNPEDYFVLDNNDDARLLSIQLSQGESPAESDIGDQTVKISQDEEINPSPIINDKRTTRKKRGYNRYNPASLSAIKQLKEWKKDIKITSAHHFIQSHLRLFLRLAKISLGVNQGRYLFYFYQLKGTQLETCLETGKKLKRLEELLIKIDFKRKIDPVGKEKQFNTAYIRRLFQTEHMVETFHLHHELAMLKLLDQDSVIKDIRSNSYALEQYQRFINNFYKV